MIKLFTILALLSTLTFTGCSAVQGKVAELTSNDLQRTMELAEKYGKPGVASCASFLKAAIDGDAALAKEDTAGLISLAFKLYLLQDSKPVAEEQFKQQCGSVAAGLLIQAGKSLR